MATNVSATQFFRTINKRHYACAAKQLAGRYSNELEVSSSANNTIVGSIESLLPVSRLSVILKAGSRYDPIGLPGLNHILRASSGLTTSQSTAFGIMRNIQEIGANISCTGNRDIIAYTLEASCDKLDLGLKYLRDIVVNQAFKPWELEDNYPHIRDELAVVSPEARLVDLLHKAAYRTGLGNPLYVEDFNIGKFDSESLQCFVASHFTSSRAAVIGVGIDQTTVCNFSSDLELPAGCGPTPVATYRGGDLSLNGPTSLAYVGVAAESAGLSDSDVLAFNILRYALGGWSTIKWSTGNSPLAKLVTEFPGTTVSAFNAVHADSGLFGFLLATSPRNAKKATLEAYKLLKNTNLSEELVTGAKNQYIRDLSERTGEEIGIDFGFSLLHSDSPHLSLSCLVEAIDNVSAVEVNKALSRFTSLKKTVVSYGRLAEVAYSEDLK